jgi:predicted dithiol-disulfide oxidoreductase (DUF899 family)
MEQHKIVSQEQWLAARRELLTKEKEFTHLRDKLSALRRELPWVRVEREYGFEGPQGKVTLAQLFEGKSQLVIYHLMFQPESQAPCRSCAFWADAFDGMRVHLAQRDVRLIAVSRAPKAKLDAFAVRMGWTFPWYSAVDSTFNIDHGVTFPNLANDRSKAYNFGTRVPDGSEMPGVSVFVREADGTIFHTYSCYARGIDALNPAYQYLDLVPKGRDEAGLSHAMAWVRHHDNY